MTTEPVQPTVQMREFARRYTLAWCSKHPASVAACYAADGSLKVNDNPPAVGRDAITGVVHGFMTDFPDMQVFMDDLRVQGDRLVYRWTLTGTNTGPGGNGNRVRLSGFEQWRIGVDGLIAESCGHFDAEDYNRQLKGLKSEVRRTKSAARPRAR
jgi:predicted ester cyclase